MSGVLVTRRRIPGAFIERIWIKRATPHTPYNGQRVMRNKWITLMDTRSDRLSFTGWTGVQKSGYSDVFKEMMRKLRHAGEALTFVDVFKESVAKSGYGNLSIKCCPPVWHIHNANSMLLSALWHDSNVPGRQFRAHVLC